MPHERTITVNRGATYNYEILERIEAGLVLQSTEIKSVRENHVNLSGGYAFPLNGELWLQNCHIAPYPAASWENHEPRRPRKLLLRRGQMRRFCTAALQKGFTIVPLKLYIAGHYAKVELGIGRGRKRHDKRQVLRDRERRKEARDAERR